MRLLEHLLNSWFLVDPVVLCRLPALNLLWLEPKGNFLLRAINGIRTVADIAADIDGVVTTDGARGGGSRVGSTEEDTACLYGVTAFPDHGTDWAGGHVFGVLAGVSQYGGRTGRNLQDTRPGKKGLELRSS